jgi:hypothetical protein
MSDKIEKKAGDSENKIRKIISNLTRHSRNQKRFYGDGHAFRVMAARKMGKPAKHGTPTIGDPFGVKLTSKGLRLFGDDAQKKMASGPHP